MATIQYDLAAPGQDFNAEVLDESGRRVARLTGTAYAGRNKMTWDTTGIANGVYFLRIKVRRQDGKQDTVIKKLAVVK
jgi:hypothetical protein